VAAGVCLPQGVGLRNAARRAPVVESNIPPGVSTRAKGCCSMAEVSVAAFAAAHADGAFVVDVREPFEYVGGHVPGAWLVPVGELPSRLRELPRDERVYVICASGNRSRVMTDELLNAGFDAWSVAGGTSEWARTGQPVVAGLHSNEA